MQRRPVITLTVGERVSSVAHPVVQGGVKEAQIPGRSVENARLQPDRREVLCEIALLTLGHGVPINVVLLAVALDMGDILGRV